tara:strand:+ start:1844 stop:2140 length:297 start_codon:yes stop_codon:yes gene_type:complete
VQQKEQYEGMIYSVKYPDDYDDQINPEHYKMNGNNECIDIMVDVFGMQKVKDYCEMVAFKYLWRMNTKHETSLEDKQKAIWYLRFSIGDDPRKDNNDE